MALPASCVGKPPLPEYFTFEMRYKDLETNPYRQMIAGWLCRPPGSHLERQLLWSRLALQIYILKGHLLWKSCHSGLFFTTYRHQTKTALSLLHICRPAYLRTAWRGGNFTHRQTYHTAMPYAAANKENA